MSEQLAEQLRSAIANTGSPLLTIATACDITYSRLHGFVKGGDITLSTAQKLIDHFKLQITLPKRRKRQ